MPRKQRVALILIFLIGGLCVAQFIVYGLDVWADEARVTIAGIIRMALVYKADSRKSKNLVLKCCAMLTHNDFIVRWSANIITTTIENGLAIICACLPTCRPIFTRSTVIVSNAKTWCFSLWNRITGRGDSIGDDSISSDLSHNRNEFDHSRYRRLKDRMPDNVLLTEVVGGQAAGDDTDRDFTPDIIQVKCTAEIV